MVVNQPGTVRKRREYEFKTDFSDCAKACKLRDSDEDRIFFRICTIAILKNLCSVATVFEGSKEGRM